MSFKSITDFTNIFIGLTDFTLIPQITAFPTARKTIYTYAYNQTVKRGDKQRDKEVHQVFKSGLKRTGHIDQRSGYY